MFNISKQLFLSFAPWINFIWLSCQIKSIRQNHFDGLISHLESNVDLGDSQRAAYFQEVIALAKLCRSDGPLAVTKIRARPNLLKTLKKAFIASGVLCQMKEL